MLSSQCKWHVPPRPLQAAKPPGALRQPYQHQSVPYLTACCVQEVKQLVYFSMINFARTDFQSSKFGLWSCYRLCTSLFRVLSRGAASASSLGCSGSLRVGSMYRYLFIHFQSISSL